MKAMYLYGKESLSSKLGMWNVFQLGLLFRIGTKRSSELALHLDATLERLLING